jgi:2-oxoglutarate dehydrogenase E2 component (dihydrolipoamide succinyltransferase)
MSVAVNVPAVGESISEVTIAQWNKKDGEYVEVNDVLCELESDKATFELNAEVAGILRIQAQEGETVPIGALICHIEPAGATNGQATKVQASPAAEAPKAATQAAAAVSAQTVDMVVPSVGESITEVTISAWHKKDGDTVAINDVLCEIESDKATFEVPSEHNGILRIVAAEGETVKVGALICRIEASAGQPAPAPAAAPEVPATKPAPAAQEGYAAGHPSPAASKILAEKGIAPEEVKGSGVGGRITKEDAVQANARPAAPQPAAAPAKTTAPSPAPTAQTPETAVSREERREKMTSLRKTISKRLVAVKNETAMLTTFNEVDMKAIMDIRAKYKDVFKEKHGVGLGFMSFFTKAVCEALQEWPAVNAMINGEEIVYHHYCDVSIAVSTPRGLVVPVIRNAEKMSLQEIEKEILRLALKARDNKLTIPEMTGGTFTITNGGVFGSMMSTPIINAPQSAILGMHNIVERPVAIKGEVVIRPMMYLALSYDHRIIDGRESVSFLVRVKQLLEDPMRLMLGV